MNETQVKETNIDEVLYCTVHPDRETTLRCNRCNRPMCPECAVLTPVGYRCRECVHEIQDAYYTATSSDYVKNFLVCAVLTGIGGAVFSRINIGILFTILIAIPLGALIAEGALRVTSKRRGRQSALIAGVGALVGGLLGGFIQTFIQYQRFVGDTGITLQSLNVSFLGTVLTYMGNNVSLLVYVALTMVAVFGRFKLRT